jgi:hypothetical protein
MKHKNNIVVVLLLFAVAMLLSLQSASAQVYRVSDEIYQAVQLKNSAVDSTMTVKKDGLTYFTIPYNGTAADLVSLRGAYPDSIKVTWFSSGDSISYINEYWKAKLSYAPLTAASCVWIDSIKNTGTKGTSNTIVVPGALWQGYDQFGLSLGATASGNAVITSHASKVYVRVDRYFRKR